MDQIITGIIMMIITGQHKSIYTKNYWRIKNVGKEHCRDR